MSILYFLGLLEQLTNVFIILFSVIAIAIILGFKLFNPTINFTLIDLINKVFHFYTAESSLVVFAVKVLITALVFFSGATLLSSKLEVRR
jgi:H+/Cl- antiporter ClcA